MGYVKNYFVAIKRIREVTLEILQAKLLQHHKLKPRPDRNDKLVFSVSES